MEYFLFNLFGKNILYWGISKTLIVFLLLNETESAVFKLWMLCFQISLFRLFNHTFILYSITFTIHLIKILMTCLLELMCMYMLTWICHSNELKLPRDNVNQYLIKSKRLGTENLNYSRNLKVMLRIPSKQVSNGDVNSLILQNHPWFE